MANLNTLIQKYINNEISLSQKDISEAAKSREWFLNRIKNKINEKLDDGELIPQLNSETPFVNFGSYFKGTKVKDVDEYDILVVLDSNAGLFTQSGTTIGTGVGSASPCNKYRNKYRKSDGSGVSPAKLLNWLKGIVEEVVEGFSGEAPERNGQAITATIKNKNLKIDLVPAGQFEHTQEDKVFYDIPMGNSENDWILTSPQEDITLIADYAKDRENLKNIIRLLKNIKDNYTFDVSSFAIECSILRYAHNNDWSKSLYYNFSNSLIDFSSRLRAKKIVDTFDEKKNLISHLDTNEWYADRIDLIVQCMASLEKEEDDEKAYTKLYKKLKNEA